MVPSTFPLVLHCWQARWPFLCNVPCTWKHDIYGKERLIVVVSGGGLGHGHHNHICGLWDLPTHLFSKHCFVPVQLPQSNIVRQPSNSDPHEYPTLAHVTGVHGVSATISSPSSQKWCANQGHSYGQTECDHLQQPWFMQTVPVGQIRGHVIVPPQPSE